MTEPAHSSPYRKGLKTAVSALCSEVGFSAAENNAIETLTEMIQAYVYELGRSSRAYSELSCRTEPMLSDVVMALVEMGMDVRSLPAFAKRANKTVLTPPSQASGPYNPRLLQVGEKKGHPSHIPDYLPPFPDPHNYLRTQTHKEPDTDYQSVREKASTQKRDVERALTRFIAKTGETESLFSDDPYAFPLIANKPKPLSYIDCLMPKEEDLALQDKMEKEDKKSDEQDAHPNESIIEPSVTAVAGTNTATNELQTPLAVSKSPSQETVVSTNTGPSNESSTPDTDSQIDNPYLREIKMPKLKGAGKKSSSIQAMSSSTKWSF